MGSYESAAPASVARGCPFHVKHLPDVRLSDAAHQSRFAPTAQGP